MPAAALKEKKKSPSRSIGKHAALLDRRAQLSEQMTQEKSLDGGPQASVPGYARCSAPERSYPNRSQIDALSVLVEQMYAQFAGCRTVGVGPNTAWSILAYLSEIQPSALNGSCHSLAPYNRDSGKHTGKRRIGAAQSETL